MGIWYSSIHQLFKIVLTDCNWLLLIKWWVFNKRQKTLLNEKFPAFFDYYNYVPIFWSETIVFSLIVELLLFPTLAYQPVFTDFIPKKRPFKLFFFHHATFLLHFVSIK
jgi:hypothetical protein